MAKHDIIRVPYTAEEIAEVRRLGPTRYAMATNVPLNVVAMRLLAAVPVALGAATELRATAQALAALPDRLHHTDDCLLAQDVGPCTCGRGELQRAFKVAATPKAILGLYDQIEALEATFDLRWKADMRAIKRWQDAHPGNELVWPDHADLVVWLMEQLDPQPVCDYHDWPFDPDRPGWHLGPEDPEGLEGRTRVPCALVPTK
jgi:hypothetical protein